MTTTTVQEIAVFSTILERILSHGLVPTDLGSQQEFATFCQGCALDDEMIVGDGKWYVSLRFAEFCRIAYRQFVDCGFYVIVK